MTSGYTLEQLPNHSHADRFHDMNNATWDAWSDATQWRTDEPVQAFSGEQQAIDWLVRRAASLTSPEAQNPTP